MSEQTAIGKILDSADKQTDAYIPRDRIVKLSEGNSGAVTVLVRLCAYDDTLSLYHTIEAWDLTGAKIWIAYKDVCDESSVALAKALREAAGELAGKVEQEMGDPQ